MTGGRLKRLKKYLDNDTFMMTYGDGISDVNIKKLIKFHKSNNVIATLTAVRPPARFGAIKIKGKKFHILKKNQNQTRVGSTEVFILNLSVRFYSK